MAATAVAARPITELMAGERDGRNVTFSFDPGEGHAIDTHQVGNPATRPGRGSSEMMAPSL